MRDTLASGGTTSTRGLQVRCGNKVVNKVFRKTDVDINSRGDEAVAVGQYKASPLTTKRARSHDPVIDEAYDKVVLFPQ